VIRGRQRLPAQSLVGLLLLAMGLLLFLQNVGWLGERGLQFWPLALIVVGTLKLLAPGGTFDRLFGLSLVAFGTLRIATRLLDLDVGPLDILAVVLVGFGAALLWRGVFGGSDVDAGPALEAADTFSALAFMGGYATRLNSQRFRGGDVTALMGGVELDLRACDLQEPAVIDIFAMWAGIEIRVPEDWLVELQGMPILAGFEEKTRARPGTTQKRLIVRGSAIMGGIEVKN
jgi:hypothetical protein